MKIFKIAMSLVCTAVVSIGGVFTLNEIIKANSFNQIIDKNVVALNLEKFQSDESRIIHTSQSNEMIRFVSKKQGISVVVDGEMRQEYIESIYNTTNYLNNVFEHVNSLYHWNVGIDGVDGASVNNCQISILHESQESPEFDDKPDRIGVSTIYDAPYIVSASISYTNKLDEVCDYFYPETQLEENPLLKENRQNFIDYITLHEFLHTLGLKDLYSSESRSNSIMYYSTSGFVDPNIKMYQSDLRAVCSLYADTPKYGYEKFQNLLSNGDLVMDPISSVIIEAEREI